MCPLSAGASVSLFAPRPAGCRRKPLPTASVLPAPDERGGVCRPGWPGGPPVLRAGEPTFLVRVPTLGPPSPHRSHRQQDSGSAGPLSDTHSTTPGRRWPRPPCPALEASTFQLPFPRRKMVPAHPASRACALGTKGEVPSPVGQLRPKVPSHLSSVACRGLALWRGREEGRRAEGRGARQGSCWKMGG